MATAWQRIRVALASKLTHVGDMDRLSSFSALWWWLVHTAPPAIGAVMLFEALRSSTRMLHEWRKRTRSTKVQSAMEKSLGEFTREDDTPLEIKEYVTNVEIILHNLKALQKDTSAHNSALIDPKS